MVLTNGRDEIFLTIAASFWVFPSRLNEPPWKREKERSWFRLTGMPLRERVEMKPSVDYGVSAKFNFRATCADRDESR